MQYRGLKGQTSLGVGVSTGNRVNERAGETEMENAEVRQKEGEEEESEEEEGGGRKVRERGRIGEGGRGGQQRERKED